MQKLKHSFKLDISAIIMSYDMRIFATLIYRRVKYTIATILIAKSSYVIIHIYISDIYNIHTVYIYINTWCNIESDLHIYQHALPVNRAKKLVLSTILSTELSIIL
jgi:hypothetical protein